MAQQAVPVLDLPMSQLEQDKEIKRWSQLSEGRVHNHSVRGCTQRKTLACLETGVGWSLKAWNAGGGGE